MFSGGTYKKVLVKFGQFLILKITMLIIVHHGKFWNNFVQWKIIHIKHSVMILDRKQGGSVMCVHT